jgi:hypothetical protein
MFLLNNWTMLLFYVLYAGGLVIIRIELILLLRTTSNTIENDLKQPFQRPQIAIAATSNCHCGRNLKLPLRQPQIAIAATSNCHYGDLKLPLRPIKVAAYFS